MRRRVPGLLRPRLYEGTSDPTVGVAVGGPLAVGTGLPVLYTDKCKCVEFALARVAIR